MSRHFTLAVTFVMQSCKSIGPWRYHKPLHLLSTGALRQESGKPLGTELQGDIFWKHPKAQQPQKKVCSSLLLDEGS